MHEPIDARIVPSLNSEQEKLIIFLQYSFVLIIRARINKYNNEYI